MTKNIKRFYIYAWLRHQATPNGKKGSPDYTEQYQLCRCSLGRLLKSEKKVYEGWKIRIAEVLR